MTDNVDTISRFFRAKRVDIAFLCGVFDSLEGMVAVRSPNPAKGGDHQILHVMISPYFLADFENLLTTLRKNNNLEEVSV
ncbi:MAG: hypothetical protein V1843_03845 [bacterium]